VIRWTFQRNANAITCELDLRTPHAYEICIVPHWAPASAVIECFDAREAALGRHTELTKCLRENGWMVIERVAADRMRAAV
jgi:hypothetical protein